MIRLLLLLPFILPLRSNRMVRARLALWCVRIAARLDAGVLVLAAQAIAYASEASIAKIFMEEQEENEKKNWPPSILN